MLRHLHVRIETKTNVERTLASLVSSWLEIVGASRSQDQPESFCTRVPIHKLLQVIGRDKRAGELVGMHARTFGTQ